MFKASTVYAAYGKEQQATSVSVTGQHSGSSAGSLSSSESHQHQQHEATAPGPASSSRTWQQQQHQHNSLRSVRSMNIRLTAEQSSTASASSSAGVPPAFTLEPRTWVQQAADVTDGLLDASKYRSLAVYAEVKLAEALDKASQACPSSITGAAAEDCQEGQPLPNPLATAVCCQLLGELADMCGPFQPTLLKLRDALLPAVYSSCSGPSLCGSRLLQFDMLPWFALAGRLRHQNNQLLEQQAVFRKQLAQHQEHMVQVEQQLQGLQAALEAGTATAAALQATNASLVAERTAAVAEASTATEEAKRLGAEVTRLTAELDVAQEQLATVKEELANEQDSWKAQVDAYMQKLHVESHERAAALALAASEQQELEQKLWEAERKLEEAEQQLQQHSSSSQAAKEQQQLTPLPTDWGPAAELAAVCQSTAETVWQLQQQHAQQVAGLQRQVQVLAALALPEPAPKAWQLNLKADASKYFLTELDADPTAQALGSGPAKPKLFAMGLGWGADVPRFLRWDAAVEVRDVSLQDLEQQVDVLWQSKARSGPCSLQAFLHEHFWAQASCEAAQAAPVLPEGAAAAAAGSGSVAMSQPAEQGCTGFGPGPSGAAAAGGLRQASNGCRRRDSSDTVGPSTSTPPAVSTEAFALSAAVDQPGTSSGRSRAVPAGDAPTAAAAVAVLAAAMGYQLYYACCTHRHDSAAVELLLQVLTGQLPETALQRPQHQQQESALRDSQAQAAAEPADASADVIATAAGAAAAGQ